MSNHFFNDRPLLNGLCVGPVRIFSDDIAKVKVSPCGPIVIGNRAYTIDAQTDVTAIAVEGTGAFAPSTKYALYALWQAIAGTDDAPSTGADQGPVFTISTTMPTDARMLRPSKPPQRAQRFLGFFRTDSSGHVVPFVEENGIYIESVFGDETVLTVNTLDFSAKVPPWARQVIVHVDIAANSAVPANTFVTYGPLVSQMDTRVAVTPGTTAFISAEFWLTLFTDHTAYCVKPASVDQIVTFRGYR